MRTFMPFTIWACGSNGSFQLGLGNDDDHDELQIVEGIPELSHMAPKQLVFGGNHTFILFPDDTLYAAGANTHGQCGIANCSELRTFTKVPGKWQNVAAGWEFSVLQAAGSSTTHDAHKLYVAGSGPKGELGLGPQTILAPKLTKIDQEQFHEEDIASISCSINHTVVRLRCGTLYGWGVCRKGQLGTQSPVTTKSGRSKPLPSLWSPQKLPFTAESGVCLGKDRTVVWGPDSLEVFGAEAWKLQVATEKVEAMWTSVHYSTGSEIVSVGNNSHGQLYNHNNDPSKTADFTVGSEHGLVLSADNEVKAWGWGEHGNCGKKKGEKLKDLAQDVTFNYLNTIYSGPDRVVLMAGGLATSWVVTKCDTASSPHSSMR